MCLPVLHFTTLDLFADFMWVVELFPFSTHNALRTYTCSKKKKTPSTVGRALSPFTSSYRVGPCEADASCTQPLSLSLSLLYTSKETWEHESVVLTTTCAHTQPVHTTHHHRKQVTSGSFQSSKKKISHRAHTMREEGKRERDERGKKGRGGQKRKENCSNQDSRVVPHRSTN